MPEYNPDWASPPYDSILDSYMSTKDMSEKEANDAIKHLFDLTDDRLAQLVTGNLPLTEAMCKTLADTFRNSDQFWKNREMQYRVQRRRIEKVQERLHLIDKELKAGKRATAIDLIYGTKEWPRSSDFMTTELLIRKVTEKVGETPDSIPVSLLTATLPWAREDQIRESRWDLYDAVYNHIEKTQGREHAASTLANLRS